MKRIENSFEIENSRIIESPITPKRRRLIEIFSEKTFNHFESLPKNVLILIFCFLKIREVNL